MNDDTKNPEPQPWIDPALEARVVAAVLGETSSFEASELERAVAENPELSIFQRRIQAVHALVGTAVRSENPKILLSPERRRKLLETIGVPSVVQEEKVQVIAPRRPAWWSPHVLLRVAACLVVGLIVLSVVPIGYRFRELRHSGSASPQALSKAAIQNLASELAAPSRRRYVQSWDDVQTPSSAASQDGAKLATAITAYETEYGRLPTDQDNGKASDLGILPKEGDGSVQLRSDAPQPASTPVDGKDMPVATARAIRGFTGGWGKGSGSAAGTRSTEQDSVASQPAKPGETSNREADSAELPQVTTRSGQTEIVQTVRDFPYPSEFAPPQVAQAQAAPAWNEEDKKSIETVAKLEVPAINPITDQKFDGQIDYGSPINPGMADASSVINQPIFTTRQVAGEVAIFDGQSMASGGVVRNDTQQANQEILEKDKSVEDREPLLGDVPLAGRLSRQRQNAPLSPANENVVNQPVFSSRDGKVEFDGFINYGSPINTVQTVEQKEGQAKYLLDEAEKFSASGRQDLAFKRYEQTLEVDPNNIAARRGMGQVNEERAKSAAIAYNEARGDLFRQVDKGWEMPVRRFEVGASTIIEQPQIDTRGTTLINRKLDEITIPRIDFQDATLREAIDFLKQRAASLDAAETDPSRKGINIVLKLPPEADESKAKLTLALTDIPLRLAIDYVAKAANLKLKIEPYAVAIVPLVDATQIPPKPPAPSAFQSEILTAKQPFSTFSLHVSDVSFQLAKDALAKGTVPDPARIRAEEFYNAFDYNDPSPAPGEEVACRIEQAAHPFLQQRDLVRIALKVAAAGRAAGQPLRLTLLLDTSGSMEREDRAVSVRRALETLANLLGPQDRVTLIGFARTPRLLAEQVPGDQAGKLVEIADRTPSEGGTNLEEALALASEMALKQKLPAAQNRIVLLTDGAANLGNANPVRLARQIEKTRQQGISFDACGVGANGLNDEMLEALTRKGDGRYYFLNKPENADTDFARQLAGALRPAAENVKVQVVFNPARVSQYRLIGFEKHLLEKEDFRNDKVQAAELSAEEAGVALYQVQTLPEGEGDLGQVFVRFRDPASGSMVERSWTMPYDARARAFDQASPSLQLAATAALLAEKLRGDSQLDLTALAPVINNLRGHYPNQERVGELIQMFEQMRR